MTKQENRIDILKKAGYKITPQRLELLKALSEEKMQTAEELYNIVISNHPKVSLDTIYRNLHILQQLNIITETKLGDSKSRYKLSTNKHNHHMVCIKCGCSVELDFCPMELIKDKIDNKNFKVTGHNFEIIGYCSNCL